MSFSSIKVASKLKTKIILVLILTTPFLTACSSQPEVWVFEAPRAFSWSAFGYADKPVVNGDYIIFRGGYSWQNQIFLYVVDKKTGKLVWKNDRSTQEFKAGKNSIIVSTRQSIHHKNPSKEHETTLICYKLDTGTKLWEQTTRVAGQEPKILSFASSVNVWIPGKEFFSLDPDTGKYLWREKLDQTDNKLVRWATVIANGDKILAAVPSISLSVIDGESGKPLDRYSLAFMPKEMIYYMQMLDNNCAIFVDSGYLSVLDMKEKKLLIQKQVGLLENEIARDKNKIFFVTKNGPKGKVVYKLNSINLITGKIVWSQKLAEGVVGKPCAGEEDIFIGTTDGDGKFYAIDKKTGKVHWQVDIGPVKGEAEVKGGIVYVCGKEYFYALDEVDGSVIWQIKPRQYEPSASCALDRDKVYFVGQDSYLYCLKQAENLGKKSMKKRSKWR